MGFLYLLLPPILFLYPVQGLGAGNDKQVVQVLTVKPVSSGNDSSECCWQGSGVIC